MSDRTTLGSLRVLREPGRPPLAAPERRRGELLANLAALAMRKIILLEHTQAAREHAEHLLDARSRLIRGLSHDLRNPLGAILGYAALLDEGLRGPLNQEQRSDVQRIHRAGRSMDLMIQHLVEVGRSDTAEVPLSPERMSIVELARELIEEHRGQAEQAGLSLVDRLPDELPAIRSDPIHVRTVLGNLLSNAVKYTSEGGIEVRGGTRPAAGAEGPASWVFVEVRDTGPGIRAEDRETVFQEFARLHTDRAPGEGIGLASSRRVAHRLGGRLLLESTPGRGSAFTLMLPAG